MEDMAAREAVIEAAAVFAADVVVTEAVAEGVPVEAVLEAADGHRDKRGRNDTSEVSELKSRKRTTSQESVFYIHRMSNSNIELLHVEYSTLRQHVT